MSGRKKARRNWPCPICGQWSGAGCEHINANSTRLKLRFRKQAEAIERLEAAIRKPPGRLVDRIVKRIETRSMVQSFVLESNPEA